MNGFNKPSDSTPLPYTSSPVELVKSELKLFKDILFHYPASIPGVLQPFWSRKPEDELCLLNPRNIRSIFLHIILIITQTLFLLALIYALIIPVPASAYLIGMATSLTLNYYFCKLLNGDGSPQTSTVDLSPYADGSDHSKECWVFINGVSVGRDWFQSNLNTLSLIFRRPIIGVHNITYGIIFDLIECLIQRDSCYATEDIRTGYAKVKKCLLDDKYEKVVLIVHSQGGIEAGAIFDWLLDDLPADQLAKLEIYTFGSAANHFNNPCRSAPHGKLGVVKHIEHYTNCGEFVSRFGILGFIHLGSEKPKSKTQPKPKTVVNGDRSVVVPRMGKAPSSSSSSSSTGNKEKKKKDKEPEKDKDANRFKGRLFKRNAKGHMLNQHYLAYMFPREHYTLADGTTRGQRVAEHNEFMDCVASPWDSAVDADNLGWSWPWKWGKKTKAEKKKRWECMVREDGVDLSSCGGGGGGDDGGKRLRPRDLSRLWAYRNGMVPPDTEQEEEKEKEKEMDSFSTKEIFVNGFLPN